MFFSSLSQSYTTPPGNKSIDTSTAARSHKVEAPSDSLSKLPLITQDGFPNYLGIDHAELERLRQSAARQAECLTNAAVSPIHPRGIDYNSLIVYNELLANAILARDPHYFSNLQRQKQPEYLYIGCSDNRVHPNEIMGFFPGDVFVHRNIANVVSLTDFNLLAVLQYAVEHLMINRIIICGHYGCAGVMACMNSTSIGLVDNWLIHVEDIKRRHRARLKEEVSPENRLNALCELNVLSQVARLIDTQIVSNVWKESNTTEAQTGKSLGRELTVHGWIYILPTGRIKPLILLTRRSNIAECLAEAEASIFNRFSKCSSVECLLKERSLKKLLIK